MYIQLYLRCLCNYSILTHDSKSNCQSQLRPQGQPFCCLVPVPVVQLCAATQHTFSVQNLRNMQHELTFKIGCIPCTQICSVVSQILSSNLNITTEKYCVKIPRTFIKNQTWFLLPGFKCQSCILFETVSWTKGTLLITHTRTKINLISHAFIYCNSWITEIHNWIICRCHLEVLSQFSYL